jgi:hypothetical protein
MDEQGANGRVHSGVAQHLNYELIFLKILLYGREITTQVIAVVKYFSVAIFI